MLSQKCLRRKAKFFSEQSQRRKKNLFVESLDQFRRLEVREKARHVFFFFFDEPTSVLPQGGNYTTSHLHQVFCDFARIFSLFSLVFRTLNFWSSRNLIKQLFHSRLLDMRLIIANSALRASLAIYHLISNAPLRPLME